MTDPKPITPAVLAALKAASAAATEAPWTRERRDDEDRVCVFKTSRGERPVYAYSGFARPAHDCDLAVLARNHIDALLAVAERYERLRVAATAMALRAGAYANETDDFGAEMDATCDALEALNKELGDD